MPTITTSQTAARTGLEALDALGLALADHKHDWTPKQRRLYERAVSRLKKIAA